MHPKGEPLETLRIRPRHIIARRGKEFLCHLDLPFGEEIEWVDIENLEENFETEEINDKITADKENQIPIISSIENWIQAPWTEYYI